MGKDWIYLSIIVVVAVLLRLPLINTGLTMDEPCTVYVIEALNWPDLVERIRTIEMSPPLYFVLLKTVTGIFGLTTPVLALTSLVLSVVTVPLVYFLGRATCADAKPETASQVGLVAAFFATTSLLSITYSHEARSYALAGLLTTMELMIFLPFFDGKASKIRQAALFVTTALLAYTHYTAISYLGIMAIFAVIYRKRSASKSLAAIPPIVAGLATLIPWLPILKYHSSVGTPWADPTPLSGFLTVMASNASAALPLPVIPSYLLITLAAPLIIGLYIVLRPGHFVGAIRDLLGAPKLLLTATLFFYSTCIFGYITPYIFGYVRYMYPIAATAWVLLAFALVQSLKILPSRWLPIAMTLAAVGALVWCRQEVGGMASRDRSGLRQLARDITAKKFGNATYLTTPDFVGTILVYYLKYECGTPAAKLPKILGFAYPESGYLPPKHDGRAAWWLDPDLINKYRGRVRDLSADADRLVLIRDTYSPTSKLEPTGARTDELERMLKSECKQEGPTQTYGGRASTYLVTSFSLQKALK